MSLIIKNGIEYAGGGSSSDSPIPYTANKSQSGATPIEFSLPDTSYRVTHITITGTVYAPSALLGFNATVGTISNENLNVTETSSYHWSYVLSFDITCTTADGRIVYNGALNGGSQVTALLSYCVIGSGGGIPYSTTLLYDTENVFAANDTITLSDAWTNYDELHIYCYWKEKAQTPNYYAHRAMMIITKATLNWSLSELGQAGAYRGLCDLLGSYDQDGVYSSWEICATTTNSITCMVKRVGRWSADACVIKEIYGITYGSGGINSTAQKYSYLEHVIGYWVDGSPVYEKTIHVPQYTQAATTVQIPGLASLVHAEGIALRDGGSTQLAVPYYVTSDYYLFIYSQQTDSITFETGTGFRQYYTELYLTVQYTKTAS